MKVEKRLTSLEEYQRRLIRGAKKQKAIEERLDGIEKDMKRKENENENNEGFEYQNTDFDWDLGHSNEKGEDETPADVDETPAAVEQTEQGASAKETNEPATDKGAEGAENDPKPRGRPRKSTDPKKFTTPKQRTRTRSQWISSPYTEADTNEIEGRKKKKPRTEA
ncbi:hypothetical protein Bca4012_076743 [Brassica carinata]